MVKWYTTVAELDVAWDKIGFISRNYKRLGNYADKKSALKECLRLYCWCRGKQEIGLREVVHLSATLVCEMRKTKAAWLLIGKNSSLPGIDNCYICFKINIESVQQLHVQQPSTYAKPEDASAVLGSWWWAVCRPKHVEIHINMK